MQGQKVHEVSPKSKNRLFHGMLLFWSVYLMFVHQLIIIKNYDGKEMRNKYVLSLEWKTEDTEIDTQCPLPF